MWPLVTYSNYFEIVYTVTIDNIHTSVRRVYYLYCDLSLDP